jgi:hypothetical protein
VHNTQLAVSRLPQYRQAYSTAPGYDTPDSIPAAGLYLLPFASRARFLFKMDFAEAEYIARLRRGVKGHFSYRKVAWDMKRKMEELEPALGRLLEATPPSVEDPLTR